MVPWLHLRDAHCDLYELVHKTYSISDRYYTLQGRDRSEQCPRRQFEASLNIPRIMTRAAADAGAPRHVCGGSA